MKIGLVVDSTCDLPRTFFENEGIELMPITLRIGDQTFEDRRDETQTIEFHSANKDQKTETFAESIPYSSEQIESLFLDKLVREYDHVFCLTVTQSRSYIYENAMRASFGIISKYKQVRKDAGIPGRFALAVINSRNIFTGTAVLAAEVIRMIKTDASPSHDQDRRFAVGDRLADSRTGAEHLLLHGAAGSLPHLQARVETR